MEILYGILSWGSPLGLSLFFSSRLVVQVFSFGDCPISIEAEKNKKEKRNYLYDELEVRLTCPRFMDT